MLNEIKGEPLNKATFFRGIDFEPPRAGITIKIFKNKPAYMGD